MKNVATEAQRKFENLSYRSQLFELRKLGILLLKNYRLKAQSVEFIHHGENTTFKVISKTKKQYLLRLHRNDYHTNEAIHEELNWLKQLSHTTELKVPNPVESVNGHYLEQQSTDVISRRGCIFEWTDGRFFEKSVRPKHFRRLGQIIAILHKSTKNRKTNRIYWDASGLIGKNSTFGSVKNLPFLNKRQQTTIDRASDLIQKVLKKYEKSHTDRMGLIHADLHLGNILNAGNDIGLIDFDDSGYGFHVYDLVIALMSLERLLKRLDRYDQVQSFKDALIEGYSLGGLWDKKNEQLLPYLKVARRILMLGWINTRSDNPRLKNLAGRITSEALQNISDMKL